MNLTCDERCNRPDCWWCTSPDACDVRSCNEDATRDDGLCATHGWLEDNRTVGR